MDCCVYEAMRGKETTMDPLANTDLQTYIKNLVDYHWSDMDDQAKDATTRRKTRHKRSDDKAPPTGREKDKRVEEA